MIKVYQVSSENLEEMYPQSPFMYGMGGSFDPVEHIHKYEHVADLDCDTLDEAFEIGNIGPEERYTRYKDMHSVSVGDILVTDDNKTHIVASFGFDQLKDVKLQVAA